MGLAPFLLLTLGCALACSPERVDLAAHGKKVFSQFGEDGIIEKIFEIIEPTSRYVIEFGALDGILASNTRNLIVNHGWGALLIEGDPKAAAKLKKNHGEFPGVTTLEAWVYPGNVEILFAENGVPDDVDLLVIDIDSNDYYVWKVMHEFRPKVVMMEVNPWFPPPQLMVIDFHPLNFWDEKTDYVGASRQSMVNLGKKKGYELVYCNVGLNAFFVDAKYFQRFGIEDNSAEALFVDAIPRRPGADLQGRPGYPFKKGNEYLDFGHVKIKKKFIFSR